MPRYFARLTRPALLSALAVVGLTASPGPATAGQLADELQALARSISDYVKEEKAESVALGAFTAPARAGASPGPAIALILSKHLKALDVRVNPKARLEIKGDVFIVPVSPNAPKGKQQVKISTALIDNTNGDELRKLVARFVDDEADIVRLAGATGASTGPRAADDKDGGGIPEELISTPRFHLDGSRIKSAKGSPFAIEVLVKKEKNGKPFTRDVEDEDGRAYVPIDKEEFFEVQIHNGSDKPVQVQLFLDGVNSFEFSKERRPDGLPLTRHLLKAQETRTVKGWHNTFKDVDSFKIVDLPYGKVFKAGGDTSAIGTITAVFLTEEERVDPAALIAGNHLGSAVGGGGNVKQDSEAKVVKLYRQVKDSISVRYKR